MNQNSLAITVLCSHLCPGEHVKPFEPAEWTAIAERLICKNTEPYELMSLTIADIEAHPGLSFDVAQRITRLVNRSDSVISEIEKYANMGINIMTKADNVFPKALMQKLGKSCPPIFYYSGNPELVGIKHVGFVGSRNTNVDDEVFTAATVKKINAKGFSVVSGGARGIDSIASHISIANGCSCVEFIPDSLVNRIKPKAVMSAIVNNRLLIMSAVKPDSRFIAGFAIMRNRYIYAQSEGTVVIKADYNKGGTWNGAITNLKQRLCNTYCWNNPKYDGNIELIKRGALPVDESWTGDVAANEAEQMPIPEQLSLFGRIENKRFFDL
jgi:predicted Rossmann fold nucleotide-binding protein DprA/Smf involved in DNA uptake